MLCTLLQHSQPRSIGRIVSLSIRTVRKMTGLSVELTAPNGTKYTQPTGLFIANEWVAAKSGEKITSVNPTDESDIATVEAGGPEDIDAAVAAARKAFKDPAWRDIAGSERGDLLFKLAALTEKHRDVLATIETWDNGRHGVISSFGVVCSFWGKFR
jgi:aldehyde dehydrogenase (NAD+)